MTESEALLSLQEIDLEMKRLTKEAAALPQKAKIEAGRAARKKVDSELLKIVGQRKDVEMEIDELAANRRALEGQVNAASKDAQVADHRAALDLENRLDMLAKQIEKMDFQTNSLIERLEVVERAEKNAHAIQQRLDGELVSLATSLKETLEDINNQLTSLKRKRQVTLTQISPELQLRYNQTVERLGPLAVETLMGNEPSACRVKLQPATYSDLKRRAEPIDECPYCHRILITEF